MSRLILLVDFYWTRDKDPRIPLGHASLLASLTARPGVTARSIPIAVNDNALDLEAIASDLIEQAVGEHERVDIAIGAYVWAEERVKPLLTLLRAGGFRGRIILGGPQISYAGPGLERLYPEADVFIRGYGEDALARLASQPGSPRIRGVHYAGERDRREQAEVDLEAMPSPWLTGVIPLKDQRFVRFETQRGCPFKCAFCQHREAGAALTRRALSLSRIKAEIDLFCRSGVEQISVLDPIFNSAPHAIAVLKHFIQRGFEGRLAFECRMETITDEFLDVAAQLDVYLQFGLQTIHRGEGEAINRVNNMRRVEQTLRAVERRGIRYEISLIFGLPLQTLASFEGSVRWCLERGVPVIKAFPLLLLRGTQLEQERARWGFVDGGGAMPMVVESTSFDHEAWIQMARMSEALRATEGAHPAQLAELRAQARDLSPDVLRWLPRALKGSSSNDRCDFSEFRADL